MTTNPSPPPHPTGEQAPTGLALATLGGGCFWCLEAAFLTLRGVEQVVSGYAGGQVDHPSYRQVCTGSTGHAEVVQIRFRPDLISFRALLDVFFAIHDPTTIDRQGNDVGSQYRSVVFCHDEAQRTEVTHMIQQLDASGAYPRPIVTQVLPVTRFWPAESEHQNYFARHPDQPYCQLVVSPKVAKTRQYFAGRIKPGH